MERIVRDMIEDVEEGLADALIKQAAQEMISSKVRRDGVNGDILLCSCNSFFQTINSFEYHWSFCRNFLRGYDQYK